MVELSLSKAVPSSHSPGVTGAGRDPSGSQH